MSQIAGFNMETFIATCFRY